MNIARDCDKWGGASKDVCGNKQREDIPFSTKIGVRSSEGHGCLCTSNWTSVAAMPVRSGSGGRVACPNPSPAKHKLSY
ncbi:hypothetical protein Hamer_G010930 [Homarus americanus]|uniref:Uncharacterized protein n=1 Tax=Homarus americanus TaxID=6706 RepID=A0A8J5JYW2_HOMAM|nr:hypothetical protein Hamer_G010930 [Homarus americanus]